MLAGDIKWIKFNMDYTVNGVSDNVKNDDSNENFLTVNVSLIKTVNNNERCNISLGSFLGDHKRYALISSSLGFKLRGN